MRHQLTISAILIVAFVDVAIAAVVEGHQQQPLAYNDKDEPSPTGDENDLIKKYP